MKSEKGLQETMETASDLRRFLADVAIAVAHGNMPTKDADSAVRACAQINKSVNAEIRHAALQIAAKKAAYDIGFLPLQITDSRKK